MKQVPADELCILTFRGRYVYPLDLKAEDICIVDIAHSLSNQTRFTGHSREFYSIAQHSVIVSELLQGTGLELDGLLHDASEYVLHDITRVLKRHSKFGDEYRVVEDRAQAIIASVFSLAHPEPPLVKKADLKALAAERRDLMPLNGTWEILKDIEVPRKTVRPWSPRKAKRKFLRRYKTLTGDLGLWDKLKEQLSL